MASRTLAAVTDANADGSRTRWAAKPWMVCNGTLFCTGANAELVTADGIVIGSLAVGSGLDVTGQDLTELYFQGAGSSLGFFGSVHQ